MGAEAVRELCGLATLAHTFFAGAYIVYALGLFYGVFFAATTDMCEAPAGGQAPLSGPLELFALEKLHPLVRVWRNIAMFVLATAQPTSELHCGINMALTLCILVLSDSSSASWTDVRYLYLSISIYLYLYIYIYIYVYI